MEQPKVPEGLYQGVPLKDLPPIVIYRMMAEIDVDPIVVQYYKEHKKEIEKSLEEDGWL